MAGNSKPHPITIDLNQFKLHLALKKRIELTLHFNSPSRRFYLSVIALVVNEMKKQGKIISIPLEGHHDLLASLNETIGGSAGSSEEESLLSRIYKKWQHALPNLEEGPLFKVLGKKKEYDEGSSRSYYFTEAEKDCWANLFEYKGSHENVRLRFAIDKIGATLDDVVILYEDSLNAEAWEKFISSLKKGETKEAELVEEASEPATPEPPVVQIPPPPERKTPWVWRYRWPALVVAVVVVLGAVTLTIWKYYLKLDPGDVASKDKMAFPLPDVPSIAVLPFANLNGDPKQEFLCDAMTEEIITAISKVPNLFVIVRISTSTYKGKPAKVKQVSEDLGVQYVLEGGIQRSGDRLRITIQLIDALKGYHLWSERYDRDLKDIFALQDEITVRVLASMNVKFFAGGDISRAEKYAEKYYKGKQGLDCYLKFMQAMGHFVHMNIADNNLARRLAEEAIAMCPEAPEGYVNLGWINFYDYILGNTKSPRDTIEKATELAKKTLTMDDSMGNAHSLLGWLHMCKGEYDKAIAEGERDVTLNPNNHIALHCYGAFLSYAGRPEEAIPLLQKAIRISPFGPAAEYVNFGHALRMTGRFEEAVSAYKKAIQIAPERFDARLNLAAAYSMTGREKEARAEAAEILRRNPKFSVDPAAKRMFYKEQAEIDKVVNALHKAGLK